jgi:hypothetical protein
MSLKGILLVLTRSKDPKRQAAFASWYDSVHIPHVLETRAPGLTDANRFENLTATEGQPASVAIYEMSDDPPKVFGEMVKRMDKRRAEGSTYSIDCLDVMKLQLFRKI